MYLIEMESADSKRCVTAYRQRKLDNESELKGWWRTFREAFLLNVCFFSFWGASWLAANVTFV
jgi:hypothetical protein